MADLIAQTGARERPKATLRSYCNQECEGISRETKMSWAEWHGYSWISIEHDGLPIGTPPGTDTEHVARELTKWVSRALGYKQTVNVNVRLGSSCGWSLPQGAITVPWTD